MSLELVYFSGGPRLRVFNAIMEAGHRITEVYVNDPVRWPKIAPTIEHAKSIGMPVTVVKRKNELSDMAESVRGKICFSAGFNYLFPSKFLESVKICLNVHGSLLPKYAGARTLSWAIENGEEESGVTVHKVDAGMDTGPILLQRSFQLSPFETTMSLSRKTADFEPHVVIEALSKYECLGEGAFTPQAAPDAVQLPNRIPSHSELDPSRSLLEVFDSIRAANPKLYPAYFYLFGQKICVNMWRPDKPDDESDLL